MRTLGVFGGRTREEWARPEVRRDPQRGYVPGPELAAEYAAGVSLRELAARAGVADTTMRAGMLRAGVRLRGVGRAEAAIPESAADEYVAGETLAVVGKRHGVSARTMSNWLRRRGVVVRPSGRRR